MSAEILLARLRNVRRTGPDHGTASCPTANHPHGDRHPSLAWRILSDGRVLLRCHSGGCTVDEITAAVGMTVGDLFPDRIEPRYDGRPTRERQPIPAVDILRCLDHEAMIVLLAARDIVGGRPLPHHDRERLALAVDRIHTAMGTIWMH